MQILALADDLTGALEVGAKFAARGVSVIVAHAQEPPPGAAVIVVNTESRHLAPHAAGIAAALAAASAAPIIYKKTDSTLRGNIRAELEALARLHPDARIAYVPAYPAMGRTVRAGILYVDGTPVHQTSFTRDPLNPVTDSAVASVIGGSLDCTIFDGETTDDVARAASAILRDPRYRILAGPASLAEAIAAIIGGPAPPPAQWPLIRNCLIVNGSLHERSARQIQHALASGSAGAIDSDGTAAGWRVLQSKVHTSAPLDIANQTGCEVRNLLAASTFDALVVFGGDTASAILRALDCSHLAPLGELVEGVPISEIAGRGLHLITKAGGFGDVDVIARIRAILDGNKAK